MNQINPKNTGRADRGGKFLTFALGEEHYGLEILKVREILALMEITRLPHTPPHVRGVVNLRGQILKVIDLRSRLGMPAAEPTPETCVIFVEVARGDTRLKGGIIVDRVLEVREIAETSIEDAPSLGASTGEFFLGIGKFEASVTILLDIGRVVDADRAGPAQAA